MSAQVYIDKMKAVQQDLIHYIDGTEEDFEQLSKLLTELNICETKNELKSLLQLISSIVSNHHRPTDFFKKIERILFNVIPSIKQTISSAELVKLFQCNKIILLFLLDEKVLTIDDLPSTPEFHLYFYPEFENSLKNDQKSEYSEKFKQFNIEYDRDTFIANRKTGENESYICSLIRNDSVVDFISHVNRINLPLSTKISPSLFETNLYLTNKQCKLIQYAAFFGSIQIFNYLRMNNVKLTSSLWYCAIHSNNGELIHLLEENNVKYSFSREIDLSNCDYNKNYERKIKRLVEQKNHLISLTSYLSEAIICNHLEIAEYIREKILELNNIDMKNKKYIDNFIFKNNDILKEYKKRVLDNESLMDSYRYDLPKKERTEFLDIDDFIADSIFKSYNYSCFPIQISDEKYLLFLCQYDYLELVKLLLNLKEFDINSQIILKSIYFLNVV